MAAPPYLIIDPCGTYPSQMVRFLGKAGRTAIAVFSSLPRAVLWRDKWSRELGRFVRDTYVAPQAPSVRHLAARIHHDWPQLEGLIPWDEESILLGAELGELLGLGWNSLAVVERCRDKGVMKAWLRRHGKVRVNAARVVETGRSAIEFQRKLDRWPIVVKPTGGAGSENVYFPTDDGELLAACQRVLESGSGEVLLEEYIGGREYAVNGLVDAHGGVLITDIWAYDRRESHGIPNLYFEVAKVDARHPLFWQLGEYASGVVETLGLRRAPIHMEVKVDDRGPCLIEIGGRFGGGHLPMLASKLHGRNLFELAACHYLEPLTLSQDEINHDRYDAFEARLVLGVQPHEVRRIRVVHGLETVRELASFDGFGLLRPPGTRAPVTIDLDSRAWEVHLIHPDLDQVRADAATVREVLWYE